MKNNINKEFNDYKKNKSTNAASIISFERYIKSYQKSTSKLIEHMQHTPLEYKSYLESINYYLFNANMFTTVQNSFIVLKDGSLKFSTSKEFFTYLSSLNADNIKINFDNTYFNKLYRLYYSYLKCYESIPKPYNGYISNVYRNLNDYPQLHAIFF